MNGYNYEGHKHAIFYALLFFFGGILYITFLIWMPYQGILGAINSNRDPLPYIIWLAGGNSTTLFGILSFCLYKKCKKNRYEQI